MVLARLLFSPLQTGRGKDGQWLHPESSLLQRQEIIRFLGSLSRLGPEFCESSSGSGEIQFTSLNLPWDYPQGARSLMDHYRLTSLELFFSPICKQQMNIRIHNLTELPVCPEYYGNKLLNSRITTTKKKKQTNLFLYT